MTEKFNKCIYNNKCKYDYCPKYDCSDFIEKENLSIIYFKSKKRKGVHIEKLESIHAKEGLCGHIVLLKDLTKNIRPKTIETNICKKCLKKYKKFNQIQNNDTNI
jgi:hypothetical protein